MTIEEAIGREVARHVPALAGLFLVCVAGLGAAQSIRIPDLREAAPAVVAAPRPGEPCERCGVILSIREIQATRPAAVPEAFRSAPPGSQSGPGTPGGPNLVGGVVVLPFSGDSGGYVGGVGTPEMRERFARTRYEVMVRLDDGGYTTLDRSDGNRFRVGDRVRLAQGGIELLAP